MKTFKQSFAIGLLLFLSISATAATRYVDVNSASPTPPYTSWTTAATNIQEAIDAATDGDTVLVTNGTYAAGGRLWFDSGTNRVTITNALFVRSVNGPEATIIEGNHASGSSAVRCVLLTGNAVLAGFTLTNARAGIGNYPDGGGVYCSSSSVVSNCILAGNLGRSGGGAYRGTLVNCTLKGNTAMGGGGGAYNSTLINCLVISNSAAGSGGGANSGTLSNCTLTGNSAGRGGGVAFATANNCILYYNLYTPGGSAPNYVMSLCEKVLSF